MAISFVHPRPQIVDANGAPYSGAKLYFYDPGTTTERNVYQDEDLTSLHTQPVVANSSGRHAAIYMQTGAYKVRCETSTGVLIYEQDEVDPGVATGPGALPTSAGGTGADNPTSALVNLGAAAEADLSTLQSAVTTFEAKVSPSYVDGTRLGNLAGKDELALADLGTQFDEIIVQNDVWSSRTAVTNTTNTPAFDNTPPLIGEGAEVCSFTFTPLFSDSIIKIFGTVTVGGGGGSVMVFICNGTSTNVAAFQGYSINTFPSSCSINYEVASWGTTARTMSVRFGSNATCYLNAGTSGDQGGSYQTTIYIQEVKRGPF